MGLVAKASKRSYRRWTPEERMRLMDDYLSGRSLPWLSREYGRKRWAIEKELQRIGARRQPVKAPPTASNDEVLPRWGKVQNDPVDNELTRLIASEARPGETPRATLLRILDEGQAELDAMTTAERTAYFERYRAQYMERYRREHPAYRGPPAAVVYIAPDPNGALPAPIREPSTSLADPTSSPVILGDGPATPQAQTKKCRNPICNSPVPATSKSGYCPICRTGLTPERQGLGGGW